MRNTTFLGDMYPIDFEEWLWANGIKKLHIDYLKKCLTSVTPVEEALHERFRELLHQYVVVGGMPEAVTTFLETKQKVYSEIEYTLLLFTIVFIPWP